MTGLKGQPSASRSHARTDGSALCRSSVVFARVGPRNGLATRRLRPQIYCQMKLQPSEKELRITKDLRALAVVVSDDDCRDEQRKVVIHNTSGIWQPLCSARAGVRLQGRESSR